MGPLISRLISVPSDSIVEQIGVTDAIKFNYLMRWITLIVAVIDLIATILLFAVPIILSTDLEQTICVFDGSGLFLIKYVIVLLVEMHHLYINVLIFLINSMVLNLLILQLFYENINRLEIKKD